MSTHNFDLSSSQKKATVKQETSKKEKRAGDNNTIIESDEFEMQLKNQNQFRNVKEKYHVKRKNNYNDGKQD